MVTAKEKLIEVARNIEEDKISIRWDYDRRIAWLSGTKVTIALSFEIILRLSEHDLKKYILHSLEHCRLNNVSCRGKIWAL